MNGQDEVDLGSIRVDEGGETSIPVRLHRASKGEPMNDSIAFLRAGPHKLLAKIWQPDGRITPAANAVWFEAKEGPVASVKDICDALDVAEKLPRVALVKETIAPGVNSKRLRRRCCAGLDEYTGERFPAGLIMVPRAWVVLDIEKLPRPQSIEFDDGESLAKHARDMLPQQFKSAACVWQLSASSGHPSRLGEIRIHLFFMLDMPVLPTAWKSFFAGSNIVDPSAFDKAKLIFTAAPLIKCGRDPITVRHGILGGDPTVAVPKAVIEQGARIERGVEATNGLPLVAPTAPMPDAADAFTEIIAKSNILRSQHPAYNNDRARRLAFCSLLRSAFGIVDEGPLAQAFLFACVGEADANGERDAREALRWAAGTSPTGRGFSVPKLLFDASVTLRAAGDTDTAVRAARLAMFFSQLETRAA